jgi:K+-sensing histidine kinase KdpD
VELAALFARLPVEGLQVEVAPGAVLQADADLLSAALLNLLDNAQRHGARHVQVSLPAPQVLRLHDDGSGVDAARREALLRALQAQREGRSGEDGSDGGGPSGLGLLLAELVARAHGGTLALPAVEQGFAVELMLGAD